MPVIPALERSTNPFLSMAIEETDLSNLPLTVSLRRSSQSDWNLPKYTSIPDRQLVSQWGHIDPGLFLVCLDHRLTDAGNLVAIPEIR